MDLQIQAHRVQAALAHLPHVRRLRPFWLGTDAGAAERRRRTAGFSRLSASRRRPRLEMLAALEGLIREGNTPPEVGVHQNPVNRRKRQGAAIGATAGLGGRAGLVGGSSFSPPSNGSRQKK